MFWANIVGTPIIGAFSLLSFAVGWLVVLHFTRYPKPIVTRGGPELHTVQSLSKSRIEQYRSTTSTRALHNVYRYVPRPGF